MLGQIRLFCVTFWAVELFFGIDKFPIIRTPRSLIYLSPPPPPPLPLFPSPGFCRTGKLRLRVWELSTLVRLLIKNPKYLSLPIPYARLWYVLITFKHFRFSDNHASFYNHPVTVVIRDQSRQRSAVYGTRLEQYVWKWWRFHVPVPRWCLLCEWNEERRIWCSAGKWTSRH